MTLSATKPVTLPVLLIEDEPAVMAYVRATLERNGYAVVCTESGAEGLRLLEGGEFLGVVSDMRSPGLRVFNDGHLSNNAASDCIFINDAAAPDPECTALHNVHAISGIPFLKQDLTAIQHNGWIIGHEAQQVGVPPALYNDPLSLIVGKLRALPKCGLTQPLIMA